MGLVDLTQAPASAAKIREDARAQPRIGKLGAVEPVDGPKIGLDGADELFLLGEDGAHFRVNGGTQFWVVGRCGCRRGLMCGERIG